MGRRLKGFGRACREFWKERKQLVAHLYVQRFKGGRARKRLSQGLSSAKMVSCLPKNK